MKNKHARFAAASAVATLVVPTIAAADTPFNDVKSTDYFAEAVGSLTNRGIIKGYGADNTFRPYAEVTRGQAAKMITGILGYDTKNVKNPHFKDVPETHEFYGAIAALSNNGIINGYASTKTFQPNAPMTRQQMAKVIALAFNLQSTNGKMPFKDVTAEYAGYVSALFENNITTGTSTTTFGGNTNVKRGQLAAFIYRAENAKIPAGNEEAETKEIEGEITSISSKEISIAGNTYHIPATLQGLLNETNSQALTGALIKGDMKGDSLVSLTSLTITAEGTKEKPVVLQGIEQPVASLSTTIKPIEVAATLIIDTPFVEVKNVKLSEVKVTSQVQDLKLQAIIGKLVFAKGATSFIQGNAEIDEVQIYSDKAVEFAINGTISTLDVRVPKASIKLGDATKVKDILTNGAAIAEVISNYQLIQKNISKINGKAPTTGETPATGGPSSETPSTPSIPTLKEITGVVSASTGSSVTINGSTYTVDASLTGLFNNDTMKNADITVTVQNNKVTKVSSLTIKTAGMLDGKGAAIDGKLTVDVDGLKISNLTVAKDVQLTKNVQTAIDFDKVNIKGSLVADEEKTAGLRNMRVASLRPIMAAEAPVTRLKITFANSTVAFVEIKKVDTELSMRGVTQISVLSLESNASISADPDVILPNLKISKGVTHIQLNASIASVEIDTNDDIEITGRGNFESVKVKTDKSVVLKTEGTIKALASNSANIQLGTNLKVQDTLNLAGEVKPAEDMITNYEEVNKNVNVEIKEEDKNPHIAATVIRIPDRYGYATLSVMNAGNRTIKYCLVKLGTNSLVEIGQQAPDNTEVYKAGDQFIAWFTNDIEIYIVDENNKIIDNYWIDGSTVDNFSLTMFEIKDNTVIYKTFFGDLPIKSNFMYVINGTRLFIPEDLSAYKWKHDEDGIPTIEIPLEGFTYKADEVTAVGFNLYLEENKVGLSAYDGAHSQETEEGKLSILTQFSSHYSIAEDKQPVKDAFIWYLGQLVSQDLSYKNEIIQEAYFQEFNKANFTSIEQLKAMVERVDNEYKEVTDQLAAAKAAVESLFKEDYYEYTNPVEWLLPTTTLKEIKEVQALVEALPDGLSAKLVMLDDLSLVIKALELEMPESPFTVSVITNEGSDKVEVDLTFTEAQNNLEFIYAVRPGQFLPKNIEESSDKLTFKMSFEEPGTVSSYDYYVVLADGVYKFSIDSEDNNHEIKVSKSTFAEYIGRKVYEHGGLSIDEINIGEVTDERKIAVVEDTVEHYMRTEAAGVSSLKYKITKSEIGVDVEFYGDGTYRFTVLDSQFVGKTPPMMGEGNVVRAEDTKSKATITIPFSEELYFKNTAGEMIKLASGEKLSEDVSYTSYFEAVTVGDTPVKASSYKVTLKEDGKTFVLEFDNLNEVAQYNLQFKGGFYDASGNEATSGTSIVF